MRSIGAATRTPDATPSRTDSGGSLRPPSSPRSAARRVAERFQPGTPAISAALATDLLYRDDAYLTTCEAEVREVRDNGVVLDRTVFYAMGGGQPGDTGTLSAAHGTLEIVDTRWLEGGEHVLHLTATPPASDWRGIRVEARIDWARRHRIMRTHTLLHVLGALVPVGVTGGSIRDDGTGRLDFDLPDQTLDRGALDAGLGEALATPRDVRSRWITDAELDASPELVRTMSVQPPRGGGRVRLLEIDGLDLQACGGTHVRNTAEIGAARVRKIEKKGKRNRRVNVCLADL